MVTMVQFQVNNIFQLMRDCVRFRGWFTGDRMQQAATRMTTRVWDCTLIQSLKTTNCHRHSSFQKNYTIQHQGITTSFTDWKYFQSQIDSVCSLLCWLWDSRPLIQTGNRDEYSRYLCTLVQATVYIIPWTQLTILVKLHIIKNKQRIQQFQSIVDKQSVFNSDYKYKKIRWSNNESKYFLE